MDNGCEAHVVGLVAGVELTGTDSPESRQELVDMLGEIAAVRKDAPDPRLDAAMDLGKRKLYEWYIKEQFAGNDPPKTIRGMDRGTVSFRDKSGDYRVTDSSAIPRAYMVVDEKAIRRAIKKSKGEVVIEGVEVVRGDVTVSVGV